MRPLLGRAKAMISEISVLLPEPLEPTSAVVVPSGAVKLTCLSTGTPSRYSNDTSSNAISPRSALMGSCSASCSSSVGVSMISRMRSSPANASVNCVPMFAICTTGNATSTTMNTYMNRSPTVICPLMIARPPKTMSTM